MTIARFDLFADVDGSMTIEQYKFGDFVKAEDENSNAVLEKWQITYHKRYV
jgi:hypothetical protein